MGFNDLFNKGKQLFEDGKGKVTDFVESEQGQDLIDKSKTVFEDGREKVTELVESEKGQQFIDKSTTVFEDGKEKVAGFFDGDKGEETTVGLADAASDPADASAGDPTSTGEGPRRPVDPAPGNP